MATSAPRPAAAERGYDRRWRKGTGSLSGPQPPVSGVARLKGWSLKPRSSTTSTPTGALQTGSGIGPTGTPVHDLS